MSLADFINQCPGTGKPQLKCICGQDFESGYSFRRHKPTCKPYQDDVKAKGIRLKRKSTNGGYKEGASVSMSISQLKYRRHVRLWNRMSNDRAVKRGDALHTQPAIRPMASAVNSNTSNAHQMLISNIAEVEDDTAFVNGDGGIDIEAASESSKECEAHSYLESEDEEEDELWEDIDETTVDDIRDRLNNIKIEHNMKWANYRLADGFDSKGHYQPFQYKNNLPPYYIAQVSLLKILSQHRGNDLKLFDRIMNWAGHFSDEYPDIWITRSQHKCHTRKSIIPFLSNFFGTKDLLPNKTVTTLTDGSKVDIPVFDFKSVFENMMTDPELIREENLIQNNFDPNTWRPIKKYKELGPDAIVDDLTTGYLYEKGIELYCNEAPPRGISKILPCPLLFYTDEACYDKKGGCKTGPLSMCPAVAKKDVRTKSAAWFNTGYIPNYGLGHGKYFREYDDEWEVEHHRKRGMKTLTAAKKREMTVKDHQILYDAILSSFREYCHEYGGMRMMWKGELCLVKPFVLMLIGDTKEYNTACCHFNSCKVRCPCKDCLCTWDELAKKFPPKCERVTLAHRQKAMEDAEFAKLISHHQEESVWNDLPIADIVHGINGMTPLEWLHLNGQGNFKDGPEVIHNLIGKGDTKKSKKEELDLLFRAIAEEIKRNSERDIPIMALRFAIMNLTMVTANERVGNYFMLIICLSTKRGNAIMRNAMEYHKLNIQKVIDTMTALLAYDAWCRSFGIPKWEIDNAGPAVSQLMQDMIAYLPRAVEEGTHGYHKVKFHGLWLILETLKQYGSAQNTSSETGERLHQTAVGKNGDGTNLRPTSFTVQCGTRDGERTIIDQAFKYLKHLCPTEQFYNCEEEVSQDWVEVSDPQDEVNMRLAGGYTMHVSAPHGRQNDVEYDIVWDSRERTASNIKLHKHFLHCLTSWVLGQNYSDCYSITGYTELKVTSTTGTTTIYRANDYYHGGAWYDWSLIQDPIIPSIKYIGKILGFFKYNTPGFPTYLHRKMNCYDAETIASNNLKDCTTYAVVIGSKDQFTEEYLQDRIVTPFRLTSGDEAYIVPIHCITKPLAIVKNYGSTTSTGYMHCLPQHMWASLFTKLIRKHMTN